LLHSMCLYSYMTAPPPTPENGKLTLAQVKYFCFGPGGASRRAQGSQHRLHGYRVCLGTSSINGSTNSLERYRQAVDRKSCRHFALHRPRFLSCLFLLVCSRMPSLILSWTFLRLRASSTQLLHQTSLCPHSDMLSLCFLLRCAILRLRRSKLGSALCLVHGSQSCLKHFQAHVLSKQPPSYINLCYHSVVLVAAEDVCTNSTVVN
jgi:hypothetical protein